MNSPHNSRPLLEANMDSDNEVENEDQAGGSGIKRQFDESDSESMDQHEIESTTEECDDDLTNLFKPTNVMPYDRFSLNYMVFYLLGMTSMVPWNFFITAEDYWMYKFRNVTSNSSTEITPIQATFASDLSLSGSIPSTMFLILNACYGYKIPLNVRMIGSLIVIIVFFAFNTALIKADTDKWQDEFFDITIGSVVVMNIATAILSGSIFGISGQFPSEYVTAVVSGQALGGVFTAIIDIITITFATDPRNSAFVFFMIGNGLLVLSLLAYICISRSAFFKYNTAEEYVVIKTTHGRLQRTNTVSEPVFKEVLSKMWLYGFTEWLVFAVTLSVYPAVTVLINSQYHGNGHPWNDVYFVPVTNYLIFNLGDYLGRILAGMIEWPNDNPQLVAIFSMLRIAFVPALLLCNTNPRHFLPVYIHSDYIFVLMMCVFAFTNGYLANIAMIMTPRSVRNCEKEMASSTMAAFLGLGLAFGSSLSLIIVELL